MNCPNCTGTIVESNGQAYCDTCGKAYKWCDDRNEYVQACECFTICDLCKISQEQAQRE